MNPAENNAAAKPGLRERKKQRTRETIVTAALELFAERGYGQTTLAEIAEAADISPRTIFAYFDSKEDILFADDAAYGEQLKQKLEQRLPGATTVDAFREFLRGLDPRGDRTRLRNQIINSDQALGLSRRARDARFEQLLAESIAKDLGVGAEDLRPTLVAASVIAAFAVVRDRPAQDGTERLFHEQAMPVLDDVLEFLRGGLEALQTAGSATH